MSVHGSPIHESCSLETSRMFSSSMSRAGGMLPTRRRSSDSHLPPGRVSRALRAAAGETERARCKDPGEAGVRSSVGSQVPKGGREAGLGRALHAGSLCWVPVITVLFCVHVRLQSKSGFKEGFIILIYSSLLFLEICVYASKKKKMPGRMFNDILD